MFKPRVIPILLLSGTKLVKTERFRKPVYVGDPINAIKIFNDKEVDEIAVLDIDATREKKGPNLDYLAHLASECFMPMCYGGGITSIEDMEKIFAIGVEKISLNSIILDTPEVVEQAASVFGSQSIVVSIDVKTTLFGKQVVYSASEKKNMRRDPVEFAKTLENAGAGEILLNSVARDGTAMGYDLDLIKNVSSAVNVPVIACGGAGSISDFREAFDAGASAIAAGRMFVFHGKHKAVLIRYPSISELDSIAS